MRKVKTTILCAKAVQCGGRGEEEDKQNAEPLSYFSSSVGSLCVWQAKSMASSGFLLCTAIAIVLLAPQLLAVKLPFHPRDVLPLLPRHVSWPVLNSLHGAVDLLPSFVGSASTPDDSPEWKGACFYKNTAWMEFHNKTGSEFGGGTLHIEVFKQKQNQL